MGHLRWARMPPRPVPEPIAPGQESVWDYPRPPAIRASDEQIVIVLGGVEICETTHQLADAGDLAPADLLPAPQPPSEPARWSPRRGHSFCEWKGQASYLDVVGGDKVARRAAWYYPQPEPAYAALRGHVAVYAGAMDRCLVDGELVVPQPGGFYGGWITSAVSGPFKGVPGSAGW